MIICTLKKKKNIVLFFDIRLGCTGSIEFENKRENGSRAKQRKQLMHEKKEKNHPTGKSFPLYGRHKVTPNDTLLFILHPGHRAAG